MEAITASSQRSASGSGQVFARSQGFGGPGGCVVPTIRAMINPLGKARLRVSDALSGESVSIASVAKEIAFEHDAIMNYLRNNWIVRFGPRVNAPTFDLSAWVRALLEEAYPAAIAGQYEEAQQQLETWSELSKTLGNAIVVPELPKPPPGSQHVDRADFFEQKEKALAKRYSIDVQPRTYAAYAASNGSLTPAKPPFHGTALHLTLGAGAPRFPEALGDELVYSNETDQGRSPLMSLMLAIWLQGENIGVLRAEEVYGEPLRSFREEVRARQRGAALPR